METNTNYIISVKDLVKEYNDGKVTALSHCNLDVKKGEVVAIIGRGTGPFDCTGGRRGRSKCVRSKDE